MKRREFISLVGGSAVLPFAILTAKAKAPTIGYLWALPSGRVYIPKPDGRQRPLAVAALEDKIIQRAVVVLLNAIYEEDFLGSRTDSGRDAARMTCWMLSASGSTARR